MVEILNFKPLLMSDTELKKDKIDTSHLISHQGYNDETVVKLFHSYSLEVEEINYLPIITMVDKLDSIKQKEYREMIKSDVGERKIGVLVSINQGVATPYALEHIDERGVLFISPSTDVYEGMIIGENKYDIDLAVNATEAKSLNNIRSSTKEMTVVLKTPRKMSLEACLDYINRDELVEITPKTYRMRKKILNTAERKKYDYKKKNGLI